MSPNLGLLPLPFPQLFPQTKEAQCQQRWQVSTHTALTGPRELVRAELERDPTNAERIMLISQVSDRPWRRQNPRPGKGRQMVRDHLSSLGNQDSEGASMHFPWVRRRASPLLSSELPQPLLGPVTSPSPGCFPAEGADPDTDRPQSTPY